MKIVPPGVGGAAAVRPARETRRSGSASFAREIATAHDGAAAPRPVGGSALVPAVDLILALHDEDDAARERRHVVNRGEALLDRLDGLRIAMLAGRLSRAEIEALARAVSSRRLTCTDPGLAAILGDIELRAEVEIAKLEQAAMK